MIGRSAGVLALAGHGILHLAGVALLWCIWRPGDLVLAEVGPVPGTAAGIAVGGLWFAAAVLFVLAASSLRAGRTWWHRVLLAAVVVSCGALLPSASMPVAAVGLVIDWIALVIVIVASERAGDAAGSPARRLGAGLP